MACSLSLVVRTALCGVRSTSRARQGHAKHNLERGVDEKALEIRAIEVTGSHIGEAPILPERLDQLPANEEIRSVTADGTYNTRRCHDAVADCGARLGLPVTEPVRKVRLGKGEVRAAPSLRNKAV